MNKARTVDHMMQKTAATGIPTVEDHGKGLRVREEKILFQTLGFLPDAKKILHYLFRHDPEYNPHMVDYKLSRLRGTPLGCRRIHALTGIVRDFCNIAPDSTGYIHPLLLVEAWQKMAEKNPGCKENPEPGTGH